MSNRTRKNYKKNKYIKNSILLKCRLKTCKAKKYQSVYGSVSGGSARSARQLFS
jgi:hypothetical protein